MKDPRIRVLEHDPVLRIKLALRVRDRIGDVIKPVQNLMQVHEREHLVLRRGRERIDKAAVYLSFIRRVKQYPLRFICVDECK